MIVIICALLAVGAIGFTLLVRERDIPPAPVENPELKHLETRRQVLYENLKDLQFEYLQGKLSEADYQSVKSGFLNDLAGVMASIEQLLSGKEMAGKEAAAREPVAPQGPASKGPGGSVICSACGAENPGQHRFCGQCGAALSESLAE
ncbi:MAG: hypothetical protein A3F68_01425 [Acidobacteria bacterium RIFCSPLOWO2_12_FULL_54_10]|nr:MAG: hypothetical protein A3F68_01425 [Acidobacteria bacterium RIFCSPLOWO2_12_FULL_54_10]